MGRSTYDEWAWRKGLNYRTIIVDIEQRQVVGLLADCSASTSAAWFMEHPELEIINRDRAGLYADAARRVHHKQGKSLIASTY